MKNKLNFILMLIFALAALNMTGFSVNSVSAEEEVPEAEVTCIETVLAPSRKGQRVQEVTGFHPPGPRRSDIRMETAW